MSLKTPCMCSTEQMAHSVSISKRQKGVPLTAGNLYRLCLEARPPPGGWFSIADTATRLLLAIYAFYRLLVLQPRALLYFAYGWNTLW